MRAQNQKLRIEQPRRLPAHARVLAQPKEISRWLREQHLRRQWQRARRPRAHASPRDAELRVRPIQELIEWPILPNSCSLISKPCRARRHCHRHQRVRAAVIKKPPPVKVHQPLGKRGSRRVLARLLVRQLRLQHRTIRLRQQLRRIIRVEQRLASRISIRPQIRDRRPSAAFLPL